MHLMKIKYFKFMMFLLAECLKYSLGTRNGTSISSAKRRGMAPANEEVTLINTERHLLRNNKTELLKDFGGTQHQRDK